MSDEAGFTSSAMSNLVGQTINETLENFKPRPSFEIHKAESIKPKYVEHKLLDY